MDLKLLVIPRLESLRLSGILETLEVNNRQAIGDEPFHAQLLEHLLGVGLARGAGWARQLHLLANVCSSVLSDESTHRGTDMLVAFIAAPDSQPH